MFSVNGISELSLDGYLMVDPVSMSALQIFQEDSHPSAMGIGWLNRVSLTTWNVLDLPTLPVAPSR